MPSYNSEMTNEQRAGRARRALEAYVVNEDGTRSNGRAGIVVEESAQDLINDLLHLIGQECGEDEIEGILRRAREGYDEELESAATADTEG